MLCFNHESFETINHENRVVVVGDERSERRVNVYDIINFYYCETYLLYIVGFSPTLQYVFITYSFWNFFSLIGTASQHCIYHHISVERIRRKRRRLQRIPQPLRIRCHIGAFKGFRPVAISPSTLGAFDRFGIGRIYRLPTSSTVSGKRRNNCTQNRLQCFPSL